MEAARSGGVARRCDDDNNNDDDNNDDDNNNDDDDDNNDDDELTVQTANLISGYAAHLAQTEQQQQQQQQQPQQQQLCAASQLLESVGDSLLEQHRAAFSAMVSRLVVVAEEAEDLRGSALAVAREMFSDGHVSWGRVVALAVFCALLLKRLKEAAGGGERRAGRDAEARASMAHEVAAFLVASRSSRRAWFVRQGGWDGFVREYERETPGSTLRNTLVAVTGFGAMAGLAALGVRKILGGFR
ncbi:induced myeloid leukemia cell differentiation protein Mcl-1 homolog [Petromyzon marinus]|uniref:induced myeloid leukemia cell differentiation protein Mcl-1 homolog n=1 Tax=Petromyzon marinus TaxID=7757 RepID=UPI003F7046A7